MRPNVTLEVTPLRGPKMVAIVKVGVCPPGISLYKCSAAQRQMEQSAKMANPDRAICLFIHHHTARLAARRTPSRALPDYPKMHQKLITER